jgi:hypothetical protein
MRNKLKVLECRAVIEIVLFCGSVILRDVNRLKGFENRVLRRVYLRDRRL